jgi:Cu+-exporting ATPase
MTTDPVCGMSVDEKSAPARAEYQGKTYHFCSEDCRTKFQQNPDRYAKQRAGSR